MKLGEVMEIVVVALFASLPIFVIAIFFYGLSTLIWPTPSCGGSRFASNPFYSSAKE